MDVSDTLDYPPSVEAVTPVEATAVPIRLLEFLTGFGFGGTERQVVNLTGRLDRNRFETRFACTRRWGQFLPDVEAQGIPIAEYPIRSLYKPTTLRQQWRFAATLRRQRIQIVHSYNFYANTFAVPAARLAGVPVVIASIRDNGVGASPAKLRLHRAVCRLADCVLVNSEGIRQWLVGQGYREDKIRVIRNGIDLSRFRDIDVGQGLHRELGLPEGAPLVVVLARLVPHKGIETFLDAAAQVRRRHPDARFLIVGDIFAAKCRDGAFTRDHAYWQSLAVHCARLGLEDHVIFTGYRADVPAVLAQAAVSVLPSIGSEGLSNSLLESMAAGAPVIASRVGGNTEVIEREGVDGLLVAPGQADELAQAISLVLDDPRLAQRLGRAARQRVEQRFSLEHMVRSTEELYLRLLDQAAGRRGRRAAVD
jgi:glycosyltransferase involved in cell wall biosynthesis